MPLRLLALALALAAAAMLLASGPGHRLGLWHFSVGFLLLRWAVYAGLAAAVLALVALAIPRVRRGRLRVLAGALALGIAAAYVPWQFQQRARAAPPIHDIATDTDNPPQFVALLPLRASAPNSAAYGGKEIAAQQRKAYPDIAPLPLALPPQAAFSRAREAAESMGWALVASDPASGRIEATATTPWFGFKDDVVVRVSAAPGGSLVDARSVSRVGRGDAGANAARLREYLARLRS